MLRYCCHPHLHNLPEERELLHGRVECITNEQIPESACVTVLYCLPNDLDIFVWKTKQSYTGFLTAGLFKVSPRLFNNV